MVKKTKRSHLAETPAWLLSLVPLFVSPFLIIAIFGIGSLKIFSNSISEIIILSFYPIIIAFTCFFICRAHPKSVWYTPIISNAYCIIPALLDPHFWILSFWTAAYWTGTPKLWFIHTSFVLSIIAAIVGTMMGRKIINRAK